MKSAMQTLHDQNSLLRAQVNQTPVANGLPSTNIQAPNNYVADPLTNSNGGQPGVEDAIDHKKTEEQKKQLERELKIRDEIIHELEMRLADVKTPPPPAMLGGDVAGPSKIEVDMLNSQLQALHMTIANKDAELDCVQSELSDEKFKSIEQGDLMKAQMSKVANELKEVKGEQDDLLMMLADQDTKLRDFKARLKALGQEVEADDEE